MQITKSTGIRKNLTTAVLAAVSLLPLAALSCRSGPPPGSGRAAHAQPPAPLVGEAQFSDTLIEVKATLAMGQMQMPGGGARQPQGGGRPPGGGPPPGMGGAGGSGMGGGAPAMGGGGPSHALTVVFSNPSAATVEFAIVDVKSRLGNFLPEPGTLALAPGQQGALYPMRGTLPDDIRELELTVTIRTQDGRSETRVFLLKPAAVAVPAGGP